MTHKDTSVLDFDMQKHISFVTHRLRLDVTPSLMAQMHTHTTAKPSPLTPRQSPKYWQCVLMKFFPLRAAFQYGIKMSEGRKTRRFKETNEKAELDRQWKKISAVSSDKRTSCTIASVITPCLSSQRNTLTVQSLSGQKRVE